jgi:hypothetical protein
VYLSRIDAVPGPNSLQWMKLTSRFGFGRTDLLVCPVIHDAYAAGTYALTIEAFAGTEYYVEIYVSPQAYPIPLPVSALSCNDVPDSEFTSLLANNASKILCLEDSKSLDITFPPSFSGLYAEVIMPVTAGCHTISYAVTMRAPASVVDADIFCFPTITTSPVSYGNAMKASWNVGDDQMAFSICTEEVTYIHCGLQAWQTGPITVIWSSTSLPLRLPIQEVSAGDFTNNMAMGSAGIFLMNSQSLACADNFANCFNWVTSPATDPMVLWPPPSSIEKFSVPFSSTPLARAIAQNLTSPLSNTLTIVQGLRIGTFVIYDLPTFFQSAILFINDFTGATGLPLSMESSPSRLHENLVKETNVMVGADALPTSPLSYLFSIPIANLNFVESTASLCQYSDYTAVENLITEDLNAILNASFLVDLQPHRVRVFSFNAFSHSNFF